MLSSRKGLTKLISLLRTIKCNFGDIKDYCLPAKSGPDILKCLQLPFPTTSNVHLQKKKKKKKKKKKPYTTPCIHDILIHRRFCPVFPQTKLAIASCGHSGNCTLRHWTGAITGPKMAARFHISCFIFFPVN